MHAFLSSHLLPSLSLMPRLGLRGTGEAAKATEDHHAGHLAAALLSGPLCWLSQQPLGGRKGDRCVTALRPRGGWPVPALLSTLAHHTVYLHLVKHNEAWQTRGQCLLNEQKAFLTFSVAPRHKRLKDQVRSAPITYMVLDNGTQGPPLLCLCLSSSASSLFAT